MRGSSSLAVTALIAGVLLLPLGLFGPDLLGGLVYLLMDGKYVFKFSQHTGPSVLLTFVAIVALRGTVLWLYARWGSARDVFRASFALDARAGVWLPIAMTSAGAKIPATF